MLPEADQPILLKNGILLVHDSSEPPRVTPMVNVDLLVVKGLIAGIGHEVASLPDNTYIVDCTDKIVSPGFISTHAHLWQTQLKGRHSNDTLYDYMPKGNFQSYTYTPDDIYLGQLAGCLEALDGGNTTVLDHAHGCATTEHIDKAVQAMVDSGIRGVFAYGEPTRIERWNEDECVPSYDLWNEKTTLFVEQLAKKLNASDQNSEGCAKGRIEIGLAFDAWFLPKQMTTPLITRLSAAGVRTLTSHIARDAVFGLGMPFTSIQDNQDLFNKSMSHLGIRNFVASHALNLPEDQLEILKSVAYPSGTTSGKGEGLNMTISSTPSTESSMCLHRTPAFHSTLTSTPYNSLVSLGVDCHSAGHSYLPLLGTMLLNCVRIQANEPYLAQDRYPLTMRGTTSEAFNMMTVYGARALGLDTTEGGVGRLEVGRKADIVIIGTESPRIGIAAYYDPVDALLGFSNASDIETVLVSGEPVKWEGKLLPVRTHEWTDSQSEQTIGWKQIRKELLRSYRDVQGRWSKLSMEKAKEMMAGLYHIDTGRFG
ncbi:hypothetical protein H2198_006864 [Neophaeococcomyces mojaviensis]|uniref:Uncharacterized protein n=1 Tax=Neophaeococcomyces mojaviensis TaxID=3383035 RepID=A0ACC3A1N5_9EURO|nr:hypothetical protein H2198_006864 [Knufia sp. JES_112]